jgi:hypothetical protein
MSIAAQHLPLPRRDVNKKKVNHDGDFENL